MQKTVNFSEHLEQSLERIGGRIGEHRENPETMNLPEREIVKESIKSIEREIVLEVPKETVSSQLTSPQPTPRAKDDTLPAYMEEENVEEIAKEKVKKLVEVTFQKGIEEAIRESKNFSPYIEDAFHDALVDKLLPILKERGVLK